MIGLSSLYLHMDGFQLTFLSGDAIKKYPKLREFYFGNLDAFRMVANTDFMKDFIPDKSHWKSDPCDNQVKKIERK
ncbi:hypothetical protein O163_12145 [Caldanaerobacter subterraneus subsp. yonseiensis KB-1]|uniref:Uncharacterized protein n=1 Tax=Caldanaerobacter subterraneus subsp. yonseiensis KB-1 TaxID=1388761 RepID=U5CSQ9_CALSX|nr:hypothetical protein [Caldanaerobacter subterraneus]ERM91157.1 hypothetical protein O163_12145 [Caldanaerobacter subterraneus subsp. yonseiensis KB-1]